MSWIPALIIALCFVGVALYLMVFQQSGTTDSSPLAAEPTVKPEVILDTNGIIETIEPLIGTVPGDDKFNLAPILQPPGYDFFVSPESSQSGETITVELPTSVARTTAAQIGLELSERGMAEKRLGGIEQIWGASSSATNYSNEFADCQISVFGVSESTHRLAVGCMNKTDYTKLAKEVEPFYRAFIKASTLQGSTVVAFSNPDIQPSKTKGYQLAELDGRSVVSGVGTSGAREMFYQLPSGEWQYFGSAQSLPECDQFNTDELKKAYVGEKCISETGGVTSVSL